MKPKRILNIRHAPSKGNVDKNVYATVPDRLLDLTEQGHVDAQNAGVEVKNIIGNETVHFWVSPYNRTRQTFKGVYKSIDRKQIVNVYEHLGIREQDWGHLREKAITEQMEKERDIYGPALYRFTNGESVADLWDRMGDFIDTLWRDFNDPNYNVENVVIISHGRTMRMFAARWFHWSLEYIEDLKNPKNCEIWTMELDKATDRYKLITEPATYNNVPRYSNLLND